MEAANVSHPARGPIGTMGIDGKAIVRGRRRGCGIGTAADRRLRER
jgi:hypothetical protein